MGLIQSMVSYVKSFYSTQTIPLKEAKIILSVTKMIHTLKVKQINIQKQALFIQNQLISAINGPEKVRSISGEQQLMSTIVIKSQLVAAYEEIIRCANVIKNEAKLLQTNPGNISQECVLAICTVIYAYKDLELSQCINLNDFVPEPHPIIDKKFISEPLREYVQLKNPSFYTINIYVLEMCDRNKIKLEKVNQLPHGFSYSPSKYIERQSKSSAMFALSIDDFEREFIEEQEKRIMKE